MSVLDQLLAEAEERAGSPEGLLILIETIFNKLDTDTKLYTTTNESVRAAAEYTRLLKHYVFFLRKSSYRIDAPLQGYKEKAKEEARIFRQKARDCAKLLSPDVVAIINRQVGRTDISRISVSITDESSSRDN